MTDSPATPRPAEHVPTRWRKVLRHPVSQMFIASILMFLSLATTFALIEALFRKDLRVAWPNLAAALACALGYWVHVKHIERRDVTELNGSGALTEWTRGAALGTLLGLLALAPLGALGVYRIEGVSDGFPLLAQLPEMVLVSVFEELLVRGVIFRISEQAWGRWRALALSTGFFVVAHVPGQINLLGILVTAAASIAFTAAYRLSGRLWLPIGMHFAWNYLFAAVFSVEVSGHEAKGWIHGTMNGPEWLSGGAYGIEASAMALVVWVAAATLLLHRAFAQGRVVKCLHALTPHPSDPE